MPTSKVPARALSTASSAILVLPSLGLWRDVVEEATVLVVDHEQHRLRTNLRFAHPTASRPKITFH
jgi:hypothetical protein